MLLKVPRLSREVWLNVLYLSESEKESYAVYSLDYQSGPWKKLVKRVRVLQTLRENVNRMTNPSSETKADKRKNICITLTNLQI